MKKRIDLLKLMDCTNILALRVLAREKWGYYERKVSELNPTEDERLKRILYEKLLKDIEAVIQERMEELISLK